MRNHPFRLALVAVLLAGTALSGHAVRAEVPIQPAGMATRLPDFAQLVRQVKPAVVSVTVQLDARAEQAALRGDDAPAGARHAVGQGSGFLIGADGTIVTNNHVVANARNVEVTLDDGTKLKARVLGRDPATDVAVIKVEAPQPLPFLALGDSSKIEPGEWVIAVGNPYGLSGSVTAGIVSARGRDLGNGPFDNFIQVDAPINRGNSGGPLLTQDGRVVGVNTAIFSPSGGSIGIGFAVPSDTVRDVAEQIVKTGHVTRGFLGVSVQPVTSAMARALHLESAKPAGALVAGVSQGSPAEKSGIVPGDVILAVNGSGIADPRALAQAASHLAPGQQAQVDLLRDGVRKTIAVTVAPQQTADAAAPGAQKPASLGLTLAPITPDLREQLGLGGEVKGAAITGVAPNSPADQAGLQAGDVLLGVDGKATATPRAAVAALHDTHRGDRPIALRILRDGQPAFIALDPKATDDSDAG